MINKIDIAAKLRESRKFVTAASIGKIEWKSVEK